MLLPLPVPLPVPCHSDTVALRPPAAGSDGGPKRWVEVLQKKSSALRLIHKGFKAK